MNLTYTINIPDAPNNPSNDQPPMKVNTNSINSIVQIDHAGFNDNNGGYHTIIHQVKQVSDPANIANFNEVYAKDYTPDTTGGVADTQLFTQTGSGIISQLTGFSLGDLEDGWQWVGGVLLQWGRAGNATATSGSFVSGHAEGQVTFKDRVAGAIPFPNGCFIVLTIPHYTGSDEPSGAGGVAIDRSTLSATNFDYTFNSNSSKYVGFYWFAVGY